MLLMAFALLALVSLMPIHGDRHHSHRHRRLQIDNNDKVDVDLYVMSKCPDAALCERYFSSNITALSSIINLQVSHIVTQINSDGTEVVSMHGESEVWGDIQQSCALKQKNALVSDSRGHFPAYDFLTCQSEDYQTIPQNGNQCIRSIAALDHSDWSLCVNGEEGRRALVESAKRSSAAGIKTSCTVSLNGEQWCVHDGEWKQCQDVRHDTKEPDLITAVCNRYKGSDKPDVCH